MACSFFPRATPPTHTQSCQNGSSQLPSLWSMTSSRLGSLWPVTSSSVVHAWLYFKWGRLGFLFHDSIGNWFYEVEVPQPGMLSAGLAILALLCFFSQRVVRFTLFLKTHPSPRSSCLQEYDGNSCSHMSKFLWGKYHNIGGFIFYNNC